MEKTTIDIMHLAQVLVEANKIYTELKEKGVVLGVYFYDYEGKPSIQLGIENSLEWGERSRRDDDLDEISTEVFGVKIFSLVRREKEADGNAKMAV